MEENPQRIIANLTHAKDAAELLKLIHLDAHSPAEAGILAEVLTATESLMICIATLEAMKAKSEMN